ncbi:MAG TPA: 50S ribosomal protein L25/general stress protein Ctc [Pseudomonadales bacterium]|nr:50S ribosomal protein L25/general stress protein Ctc [Pseudomonadales bacterium]
MSDRIALTAEIRTDKGRGASRRLRRDADLVPVVMYGAGQDAVSLSITHKDLHRACESEAFFSQIIDIKTGSDVTPAIIRDLQRHPAKDRILHADFYRVSMDQEITVEIPLHFMNEEHCVGVRQHGGQIAHNLSSVEISCLPGDLPEYIEVDVESLDIGDNIHLSQLVVPQGVTLVALAAEEPQDDIVVSVHEQRAEVEEEEEAAAAEAEGSEEGGESEASDDEAEESSED